MLLFFAQLALAMTIAESVMIRSERVTNWGNWGSLQECPSGYFVKAINLQVESDQDDGDDTALNAVQLSCVSLNQQVTSASIPGAVYISSASAGWGTFLGLEYCHKGVATGFQLRTEKEIGDGDDTAANDMKLICTNKNGEYKTNAKGRTWGEWQVEKRCPPRMAVCGLQTQVEEPQGKGDDTALNNVDLMCCDLPNPGANCHPTDDWHVIYKRDNRQGTSPVKYSLRERVGVQKTTAITHGNSVMDDISETTGYSLTHTTDALATTFENKMQTSKKTQHNWARVETNVFSTEREEITEINIPPRCITTLSQVVGKCGPYTVKTKDFKRVDIC